MKARQTEPYLSTYLHTKGSRLGIPISGNFELTARCNFNCPMCYVHLSEADAKAAGNELTAGQWLQIAKDARDKGMVFALLTGGEPFVRKDFFEIYEGMCAMGLLVSINSNGSMLSGKILERLLEHPPLRMNISLYGSSNETYRGLCGHPAFDTVVENIRSLKKAGVDVSLNLSVTPYNYKDIENIYRIAEQLHVHVRLGSYMYPSIRVNGGKFGCGDRLSPEAAAACSVKWDLLRFTPEEFAARAEAMKNLTAVEMDRCPTELGEGITCRAGKSSFWMTWDGRMLPCGMMPGAGAKPLEIGFDAAWEQTKERAKAIRMPKECANCTHKELCPVCAAVTVTETGSFDGVPEYVCRQTKEMVEATWRAHRERKGNGNAD